MRNFDHMSERLRAIITERVESGRLSLPALPKVALEVQSQLDDPNVDLGRLSSVLDRDPLLAAQVLRVANSALHRRSSQIESLQKAVTHIGTRSLKQVLITAASRQVFVSHDRRINNALAGLWEHSVAVAFLARNVSGIAGSRDAEGAYLAGLLHDVGKAVVAIYLLEFERSLPTREALDWIHTDEWLAVINDLHRPVGAAVATHWNLPASVSRTIMEAGDYDAANRLSPTNAVLFANALAKREGIYVGHVDHESVGSLLMIGKSLLGLDDTVIDGLTRELNDQSFRPAA